MSLLTNLVSYWKLDGDSLDAHGANDGVDTAITYPAGKINAGAQGNGSSGFINVGAAADLNITGAFSFACWVKPTAGFQFLFARMVANGTVSSTYEVRTNSGTNIELCGVGGAYLSVSGLTIGTWAHVVVTREAAGGPAKIYINGVLAASSPTSPLATSLPAQDTLLGTRDDNNTFFNCVMDEAAVWDRVLSPLEAAYVWGGLSGNPYPLDAGFNNFDYYDSDWFDIPITKIGVVPNYVDTDAPYFVPYNEVQRNLSNIDLVGGDAPDTTAPVISNVTPTDGSLVNWEDGAIGFDVTDATGNLVRTNVYAWYPALRKFEIVWFGFSFGTGGEAFTAGFAPDYKGTRTAITGGFRFADVIRRGGWPAKPFIVTDAGDSAGNED